MKLLKNSLKKRKNLILSGVIRILTNNSLNINQIAESLKINWITAKENLQILEKLEMVKSERLGKEIIYKLKNSFEKTEETFFNIPITEEQRKKYHTLFKIIKEIWFKKTGCYPNKTQVQKVSVKAIKELNIKDLPYGWYMFGEICLLSYSLEKEYLEEIEIEQAKEAISNIIDNYSKQGGVINLQIETYQDNPFYLLKMEIEKKFFNGIETNSELQKALYNFLYLVGREMLDNESIEVTQEFISLSCQLLINIEKFNDKKNEINVEIEECFDSVWCLIATQKLMDNLLKWYPSREYLLNYFKDDLNLKKYLVNEKLAVLLRYVYEILPKEKGKYQGIYKEFKEIDRDKLAEEFETDSKIFREFDI